MWFVTCSYNKHSQKQNPIELEKITYYLTIMKELKEKEMFKHVDYDADRVETYLIF